MATHHPITGSEPHGVAPVPTVAAEGELDLATGPALLDAILAAAAGAPAEVLVDLDRVTFLDSSGIGTLLRAHRRLGEIGIALRVVGGSAKVRNVLTLAGVDRLLLASSGGTSAAAS